MVIPGCGRRGREGGGELTCSSTRAPLVCVYSCLVLFHLLCTGVLLSVHRVHPPQRSKLTRTQLLVPRRRVRFRPVISVRSFWIFLLSITFSLVCFYLFVLMVYTPYS